MARLLKKLSVAALAGACIGVAPGRVDALPFNQDMTGGQNLVAGSIMRPRVPGTVPVGSLDQRVESREAALKLTNPQAGDRNSTRHGQRLFRANCTPCHGVYEGEKKVPGPAGAAMGAPDLSNPLYASRSDGHLFAYIHFGGPIMPAYGWKFSKEEHWDMVNYLRHLQGGAAQQAQQ